MARRWTPERLRRQAGEIGRNTSALVDIILRERAHPEQGFRACVGRVRLAKTYGRERLEAACGRALENRRELLQLGQFHPQKQHRSPTACNARGRAGDSARQYPRPHLPPPSGRKVTSTVRMKCWKRRSTGRSRGEVSVPPLYSSCHRVVSAAAIKSTGCPLRRGRHGRSPLRRGLSARRGEGVMNMSRGRPQ